MGPALCTLPSRRTSSAGETTETSQRAFSSPSSKVARLFYEQGCFAAISLRQFSLLVSFDTHQGRGGGGKPICSASKWNIFYTRCRDAVRADPAFQIPEFLVNICGIKYFALWETRLTRWALCFMMSKVSASFVIASDAKWHKQLYVNQNRWQNYAITEILDDGIRILMFGISNCYLCLLHHFFKATKLYFGA